MTQKFIYLDTETTGLDAKRHDIVELAGIIEIDGEVKEEFDLFMQPFDYTTIEPKALEINGLSVEMLRTFPDPKTVFAQFITILKKYVNPYNKDDKFILVGQNVYFDLERVRNWFMKCGDKFFGSWFDYHAYDLMAISQFMKLAGLTNPARMKLESIASYFGIAYGAHRAIDDIRVTREVFYKYYELIKKGAPPVTERCDICHNQFLHLDKFSIQLPLGRGTAEISVCTHCQKSKTLAVEPQTISEVK